MPDTAIACQDLVSDDLVLRMLRPSDAGPITLFAGDERVARMTTAVPHPYPPGAAEAWIASAEAGRLPEQVWAIDATPGNGPEFVGVISYKEGAGEIGYWIGPPFWGTGHATRAVAMVTRHLLTAERLGEVKASVLFDNPASQRVLKKAGFRQTGECWLFSVARGMEVPAVRFALDAADWRDLS